MAYTAPDPAALKLRYAPFVPVSDEVIQYWLTDAERTVDQSWSEADYAPALMALAAHNMRLQGFGTIAGAVPSGVTSFRSGAISVSVSEAAASAQAKGGYQATPYGQEFARLLRRNKGGSRMVALGGAAVYCGRRDRPIP